MEPWLLSVPVLVLRWRMSKTSIQEHSSASYAPRTFINAQRADLTFALAADLTTAGEVLTHKAAGEKYLGVQLIKGRSYITVARLLYKELVSRNADTLNIAGNGMYTLVKYNFTQEEVNQYVYNIISKVHEYYPIKEIYTGGQTGVDLAGAIAGAALDIPTEITMPKGFRQRNSFGKDITQSKNAVALQILNGATRIIKCK